MTAFAANFVSARLVADAAEDSLALEVLTGTVRVVEYYEGQTDAQLQAWIASHKASWSAMVAEGDYDEAASHEYEEHLAWSVLENRKELHAQALATERYMSDRAQGLTHNPFAALLEAYAA